MFTLLNKQKDDTAKAKTATEGVIKHLPIDSLDFILPKSFIPDRDVISLAENIRKVGVLVPIPVYADGTSYKAICGERRVAACKLLGRDTIVCHVYTSADTCEALLIAEHCLKRNKSIFAASALAKYLREVRGYSQSEIADKLGVSKLYLTKLVYLQDFSYEERRKLICAKATDEKIFELAAFSDENLRAAVIDRIYREKAGEKAEIREIARSIRSESSKLHVNGSGIFDNSFGKLINQIKAVGKQAFLQKEETESNITYTVRITR